MQNSISEMLEFCQASLCCSDCNEISYCGWGVPCNHVVCEGCRETHSCSGAVCSPPSLNFLKDLYDQLMRISSATSQNKSPRAKWKNMRDTWHTELSEIQHHCGGEAAFPPGLYEGVWLDHMIFYKDDVNLRKMNENCVFQETHQKMEYASPSSASVTSPVLRTHIDVIEEASNVDSDLSETIGVPSDATPPSSELFVKRRKLNSRNELITHEKEKIQIILNETQDDCFHFVMSLLPNLRQLTPLSRMRARIKMEQVLLQELAESGTS